MGELLLHSHEQSTVISSKGLTLDFHHLTIWPSFDCMKTFKLAANYTYLVMQQD